MRKDNIVLRKEHETVRNGVAFYDFSHEPMEVRGPDAAALLDKIVVNNISNSQVGQGKYTTMLNERGEILDDIIIFRSEYDVYMVYTYDSGQQMFDWLRKHGEGYDVEFVDIKDISVLYPVQGPKSREVLNNILTRNVDDLKFNWIMDNKIDNVPLKVARAGFTGELGYELHFAPEHLDFIKTKLYESGKPYDIIELKTDVPLTSLPTEKGLKIMRDYAKIDPVEAGLAWTVDWDKDFIGKEVALESKENGPKVSLVGFTVDNDAEVEPESEVRKNGVLVGKVTNNTYGYTVEKSIGFALIDNSEAKLGDKVTIGENKTEALLTSDKFFDPKDKRRKGLV